MSRMTGESGVNSLRAQTGSGAPPAYIMGTVGLALKACISVDTNFCFVSVAEDGKDRTKDYLLSNLRADDEGKD
jgi:hypothetical protein